MSTVSFSAFARGQDDPARLRSGASRAAGVVTLVVLPAMVGLAVLAEQAVAVVYGPQWGAAVPVVQVLAPVAAVQALACVTASVMLAMGRSDWLYRWALANCLVGAAAMLVGSQWGLVGVSLALAAVVAVLTPFEMRMALGLIDMRLSTYVRVLVPHVLVTAVMAVAARLAAAGVEELGAGVADPAARRLGGRGRGVRGAHLARRGARGGGRPSGAGAVGGPEVRHATTTRGRARSGQGDTKVGEREMSGARRGRGAPSATPRCPEGGRHGRR